MKDCTAESPVCQKRLAPLRRGAGMVRAHFDVLCAVAVAVLRATLSVPTVLAMASPLAMLAFAVTPLNAMATPSDATTSVVPRTIAYRDLPARLCLPINAAVASDLASGRARLVLSLRHQRPIRRYGDPFTVHVLDPESTTDAPLLTFAMQPDIEAPATKDRATSKTVPQSFLIDLTNRRIALHPGEQVCLILDLSRDPSPQVGAPTAEDRLEVGLALISVTR